MLSFRYTLEGYGWSQATITHDAMSLSLRVSFLSDALRDLTDAIIALMRGASHASCTWQGDDDQHEYRWLFEQHNGEIQITIAAFDDLFSRKSDEQGTVVFMARCPRRRLAVQVLNQLWRLLNELGLEGYKEQWGHHEFPLAEYKTLESLIRGETP